MFNLLPKDEKFYDQLETLAGHAVTACEGLERMLRESPGLEGSGGTIRDEDRAADELAQNSLERLDAAFITPLDREDILHLITDLDSIVRTVARLARRLAVYRLGGIEPELGAQAETLTKMARALREIMGRLRQDHKLSNLNGQLKELRRLENEADERSGDILGKLFGRGEVDPLETLKRKEVHDLIESAIGRCEEVSRTLQRVVLKNS